MYAYKSRIDYFDYLETAYYSNSSCYLNPSIICLIKIRLIKIILQKLSRN